MKRSYSFLLTLIIICCINSFSHGQNLKIQNLKSFKSPLKSGKSYTIPFKLTNFSDKDLNLQLELKVPENCQQIGSDKKNIHLKANQSYLHIVSVFMLGSMRGGEYSMSLSASEDFSKTLDICSVSFKIKSVVDFEIYNNADFSYVFSGDSIYSDFLLKSKSNCEINIRLDGIKCNILGDSVITLLPDSIRKIPVVAVTKKRKHKPEDFSFQLIGIVDQNKSIKKFGFGKVKVFPRGPGRKSIYLAYPITLSNTFLGIKREDEFEYGFQFSLEGEGYIDKEQKHYHGFKVIGPNRYGKSVLGNLDEYSMYYKNDMVDIKLGDMTFSCSKLTESSRSGRGVDITLNTSDFVFGGFYLQPRFYSQIKNEYALRAKYKGFENTILESYFVSKKETDKEEKVNLFSLVGQGKLFNSFRYEAEFASGLDKLRNNFGMSVKSAYSSEKIRGNVAFLHSAPNFEGYYNETSSWQGNVNIGLTKKLYLTTHFRKDASKTKRDTLLAESPLTKMYQVGLQYRYSKSGSVTLRGGTRARKDRMQIPKFDYTEKNATLSLQQRIGSFSFRSSGDVANTKDLLIDQEGFSYQFNTGMEIVLNKIRMNVSGSYEKSERFGEDKSREFIYGGGFTYESRKSNLSASFRNSYSIEDYYKDRSLIDVNFNTKIADNQSLELSTNYALVNKSLDKNDFSIGIKYSLRFNAPIKKRVDIGHLSGKITREFGKSSEGIIVFFNGQVAITDADGCFQLNAIEPGKYFLIIDRKTLNIDEIPRIKTPIEIEIIKGENNIEFGITKQAIVNVEFCFKKISSRNRESKGDTYNYKKKRQVMLLMSNGISSIKKLVDINKPVEFNHLLPGKWKLSLRKSNLKDDFIIVNSEFDLDLNPKDCVNLKVYVEPKLRKINFLQQDFKIGVIK